MSDRYFRKEVLGYQCDICGRQVGEYNSRNGDWKNLAEGGELPHVTYKSPIRFMWFRNKKERDWVTYHFHYECFANNIAKIFPKAPNYKE